MISCVANAENVPNIDDKKQQPKGLLSYFINFINL